LITEVKKPLAGRECGSFTGRFDPTSDFLRSTWGWEWMRSTERAPAWTRSTNVDLPTPSGPATKTVLRVIMRLLA
jgi:hypothetical protein